MQRRTKSLYDPNSKEPFNVSRSKIDFFLECAQCFWLDRRMGITRPEMPGWSLNSAVDTLLKNEFDLLREKKQPHALMVHYNIEAVPFSHPDLAIWRDDYNKKIGATTLHKETNLNICGIVDDIWQHVKTKQLHIVDYKSTSTDYPISLDSKYKEGYKRQMEIYQWIFKRLGFDVSPTGYFFFANGIKNRPAFGARLEFENSIIPYNGNDTWIEPAIFAIKKCLDSDRIPESGENCQHCAYRNLISKASLRTQISLI
ncbi:MAG: PD-(D/E)XK nuclease family protein [Candidatus Paceibacterales bacterium]